MKNKGFTLIELLVVIAILGVLTTLLVSNMAGVRERARDAQRKSDLKEIQNALQMYKSDQTSPAYPANLSSLATNSKYMSKVPTDPSTNENYYYKIKSTDSLDYRLKACLENVSDLQGKPDSGTTEAVFLQADRLTVCTSGVKFELNAP